MFTVRRSPAQAAPPAPVSSDQAGGGAWKLLTTLGQTLDVSDVILLQRWIVEGRVAREDSIARGGQSWQTLGSLAELAPFFDIVDNAKRTRGPQEPPPSAPLVPLQPPILTPPTGIAKIGSSGALGGSAADSLGAVPQVADIVDTDPLAVGPGGARTWHKIAIMVVVASGIGYGGIVWQKRYLRPAVISSGGAATEVRAPAPVALPVAAPVAPPVAAPEELPAAPASPPGEDVAEGGAEKVRGPIIEPLDSAHAGETPKSLAAQGYVALGQGEHLAAIKLFRQELAQSPINGTAIFGLAEAYRGAGKTPQALKVYRRYLEILPFGPSAGSARFQIRSLLEAKAR